MRKFSKIVLITAAVLGVAGIGLSVGGVAMGASFTLDMLTHPDGAHPGILERWLDWDDDGWEEERHEDEAEHYSGRNETATSVEYTGKEGKKYTVENPEDLDIELSCDALTFREYDGEKLQIEVTGDENGNVKVYENNKVVRIKSQKKAKDRRIVVSCPSGMEFRKIDIEVDAGAVSVENGLKVHELSVAVDAGVFSNTDSVAASEVEAEVGTGTLDFYGLDAENIQADCGLGTMNLEVAGEQADYSCSLSCGAGKVKIGDEEYSGLGTVKKIDNAEASRKMKIDCGLGTVCVNFKEVEEI